MFWRANISDTLSANINKTEMALDLVLLSKILWNETLISRFNVFLLVPIYVCSVTSIMSPDFLQPHGNVAAQAPLSLDFFKKGHTLDSCHTLSRGIFLNPQELIPCLLPLLQSQAAS